MSKKDFEEGLIIGLLAGLALGIKLTQFLLGVF